MGLEIVIEPYTWMGVALTAALAIYGVLVRGRELGLAQWIGLILGMVGACGVWCMGTTWGQLYSLSIACVGTILSQMTGAVIMDVLASMAIVVAGASLYTQNPTGLKLFCLGAIFLGGAPAFFRKPEQTYEAKMGDLVSSFGFISLAVAGTLLRHADELLLDPTLVLTITGLIVAAGIQLFLGVDKPERFSRWFHMGSQVCFLSCLTIGSSLVVKILLAFLAMAMAYETALRFPAYRRAFSCLVFFSVATLGAQVSAWVGVSLEHSAPFFFFELTALFLFGVLTWRKAWKIFSRQIPKVVAEVPILQQIFLWIVFVGVWVVVYFVPELWLLPASGICWVVLFLFGWGLSRVQIPHINWIWNGYFFPAIFQKALPYFEIGPRLPVIRVGYWTTKFLETSGNVLLKWGQKIHQVSSDAQNTSKTIQKLARVTQSGDIQWYILVILMVIIGSIFHQIGGWFG